jgi:hypothetical protein
MSASHKLHLWLSALGLWLLFSWDSGIKPVLLKRFPASTVDELREAHGYGYGGSIIQDLGYPLGAHSIAI